MGKQKNSYVMKVLIRAIKALMMSQTPFYAEPGNKNWSCKWCGEPHKDKKVFNTLKDHKEDCIYKQVDELDL